MAARSDANAQRAAELYTRGLIALGSGRACGGWEFVLKSQAGSLHVPEASIDILDFPTPHESLFAVVVSELRWLERTIIRRLSATDFFGTATVRLTITRNKLRRRHFFLEDGVAEDLLEIPVAAA